MSNDTLNPMANMKAGVIADLTANGDRLNEIAKAHAESQKATSSDKFALRDKTPLDEITDDTIRAAVASYRENVAKLMAAVKEQKDAIAPVIGVKATEEWDKEAGRKEYLDLKARRAITIQYATKTDLLTEDEVKALPAVMSWGGGTVSDAAAAAMRPRFSDMTITKGDHTETVKPHTSGELAKVLNKKCKGQEGWTKVSSSDMTALFVGAAPENNLKKVVGNLVITVGGWTVTATPDAAAPTSDNDDDDDDNDNESEDTDSE